MAVVEMMPALVVEIVPALVVEIVPALAKAELDMARTNVIAQTNDLTFFIFRLLVDNVRVTWSTQRFRLLSFPLGRSLTAISVCHCSKDVPKHVKAPLLLVTN